MEEDSTIRYVKVATLVIQLLLETLFIFLLFWLQMQKYNMGVERIFDKQAINQLSLFIIPEKKLFAKCIQYIYTVYNLYTVYTSYTVVQVTV